MTDLFDGEDPFPPTHAAARARLAAVRPGEYARTRNLLDGAVSRLSPYITHGVLTLPVVHAAAQGQGRSILPPDHKFFYELGWREFFHHVWRHEGERIFESLHPGPLPDDAYARELPLDIRTGATGLPVVDLAVRELYATGWLHNHARMWLASYIVHLRKVHWRTAADWLYGHLLDGDLASNHLSWQWVAGTGSHKPYLFNAENVARYAPKPWHSPGSVVDTGYAELEAIARSPRSVPVAGGPGVAEPPLLHRPPAGLLGPDFDPQAPADAEKARHGRVLHAWSATPDASGGAVLPLFNAAFHDTWAWSERRWRFAAALLKSATGTAPRWCAGPWPTHSLGTADPHALWGGVRAPTAWRPVSRIWEDPGQRCRSFSQFWQKVQNTAAE
jgi:deoxyribodipyrimidine photo-lyase